MPFLVHWIVTTPMCIIFFQNLIKDMWTWHDFKAMWGEIMVKKARGAKVKVLFQGLHITRVIFALVYNLKFCISNTPFNNAF